MIEKDETIAVGYDGTPGAKAAAHWALDMASRLGCSVVLVHASGMLGRTDESQLVADLEEEAAILSGEYGIEPGHVRWHMSEGDPCSALLRAADPPLSARCVVVGSRGHQHAAGLPLGSTSHELAEHSRVPVVIIPAPLGH